jgi:hypothetical protein
LRLLELEKKHGGTQQNRGRTNAVGFIPGDTAPIEEPKDPPPPTMHAGKPAMKSAAASPSSLEIEVLGDSDDSTDQPKKLTRQQKKSQKRQAKKSAAAVAQPKDSDQPSDSHPAPVFAPLCGEEKQPASDEEPDDEESFAMQQFHVSAISCGPSRTLMDSLDSRMLEMRALIAQVSKPECLTASLYDDPLVSERAEYEQFVGMGPGEEVATVASVSTPQADVLTTLCVGETQLQTLLDTGSDVECVRHEDVPKGVRIFRPKANWSVQGFSEGASRGVEGIAYLKLATPDGQSFPRTKCLVIKGLNYGLILGKAWLTKQEANWTMRPGGDSLTMLTRQGRVAIQTTASEKKQEAHGRLSLITSTSSPRAEEEAEHPVTLPARVTLQPRTVHKVTAKVPE